MPDTYTPYNPQGWWDDAHWQKHGYYFEAPRLRKSSARECTNRAPWLSPISSPVIQPPAYGNRICKDFRDTHPGLLLKDSWHNSLDYSKPEAQTHILERFGALRGHIDGVMVDYADQLWFSLLYGRSPDRRLATSTFENIRAGNKGPIVQPADPKMTATAFYRFFSLLREGLGPTAWIHERNLEQPNNNITLGIVDSQRTVLDSDKISPGIITRSGLRWYKNRTVIAYDMDAKDITRAWTPEKSGCEKGFKGWSGSVQDRTAHDADHGVCSRQPSIAGQLVSRHLPPEAMHDIERTFPYPTEPRSARPVDAFSHKGWPRVYDFAVTPDWHQVTLFNSTLPTRKETIAVPLSGEPVDGALGLDPSAEYHVYDFWNDTYIGTFRVRMC